MSFTPINANQNTAQIAHLHPVLNYTIHKIPIDLSGSRLDEDLKIIH